MLLTGVGLIALAFARWTSDLEHSARFVLHLLA